MQYLFYLLAVCFCLCLPVAAEEYDSVFEDPVSPTDFIVGLDQDTIDALTATSPTEDTGTPVVALDPETIRALAGAAEELPETYAASGELSGGYYFLVNCALGNNVKLYVPNDFAVDAFTQDSGGLVNMTNSTINGYCPAYPDYTFSCSRFNHFTYRTPSGNGYQTHDLNITKVVETNVNLLDKDPTSRLADWCISDF